MTAINENAEYIVLNWQGINTYVDMNDILDVVSANSTISTMTGSIDLGKDVYNVIFHDGRYWTIKIDEETLKIYQDFKNKLDKNK